MLENSRIKSQTKLTQFAWILEMVCLLFRQSMPMHVFSKSLTVDFYKYQSGVISVNYCSELSYNCAI